MHRASLVLSLLGLVFMPSAFAYHPHSHHTHPDISTRDDAFPTLTHPDLDPSFHPRHPRHHVRVKQTHLCGGAGDAYTGYVDVEARHLFFYFIKSDEDWTKKDVILWTNGGPGHSSAAGVFSELGPCRIEDKDGPQVFEHGWNRYANILFVDQPIGVGFSYGDHGEAVATTKDAAIDVASLVVAFFEHFHELRGNAFHLAGESYGGRFVPLFAAAIYDLNPHLERSGVTPVNLSSIMLANGHTDAYTEQVSHYDIACTSASMHPVLDIGTCARMKQAVPRCAFMMNTSCVYTFDTMGCKAAEDFCLKELQQPYLRSGRNPYDMSKTCDVVSDHLACIPLAHETAMWLRRNSTRALIGVDPAAPEFATINNEVTTAFRSVLDGWRPTTPYVAALLERGVRVLVYVGENDWACNWVGNAAWTEQLEWSGGDGYRATPEGVWQMDGEVKGRHRVSGGLSFVTIRGAGHMAPYDKPEEALEMMRRWIQGDH